MTKYETDMFWIMFHKSYKVHNVQSMHAYLDCTAEMECVFQKWWDLLYGVEKKAVAWRLKNRENLESYLKKRS